MTIRNSRSLVARTSLTSPAGNVLILACIAALAGCRTAAPPTEVATTSVAVESPGDGTVRLDDAQLRQVRIEELSVHAPADALKTTGAIEFNADRMAKLLPPVSGQVHDLAVNVGDTVRRNDVLFVLSSREVAAAIAEHVASHKDLELAEKTFAMTEDLFAHQAASRMALRLSENDLAKARSKVLQTEEVLRVLGLEGIGLDESGEEDASRLRSRIPVRSPIDGTVIERSVTNGQFVGSDNPPLLTIADLSSVWVQADVFERDLSHTAVGQRGDVTTAAYPTDRFVAQVSHIGSVVDATTRTAKIRFLVANPGARLKPGMFASISLHLPESTPSLTVPIKAVFVENQQTYTYVQVSPQRFARRMIEAATRGADRMRVVRGLSPGDRVVTDGVLLLRQLETDSSGS